MSQKENRIQWDKEELLRFRDYLQEELERLEKRASDRTVSKAFGGNMPRKEEAERFRKSDEYKTLLKINPDDREITADIFIIENVENISVFKYFHGLLSQIMGFLLSCRRLADNEAFFRSIYQGKDSICTN